MTNTAPDLPVDVESAARRTVATNVRIAMARAQQPTAGALADTLEVDRRWVSRRLAGEFDWTLSDLLRVSAALDVTVAELVSEV